MDELVAELSEVVKGRTVVWLQARGVLEVASLTVIQDAMARVGRAAAEAVGAAWRETLVRAEAVRECPLWPSTQMQVAFVAAAAYRGAGVHRRAAAVPGVRALRRAERGDAADGPAARDWAVTPGVSAWATWAPSWPPPSTKRSSTAGASPRAPGQGLTARTGQVPRRHAPDLPDQQLEAHALRRGAQGTRSALCQRSGRGPGPSAHQGPLRRRVAW